MWAALSDSVTETGGLFLVVVSRILRQQWMSVCHWNVCVFVQRLCVSAVPWAGVSSSFQRWFCFKWCEEWLQAARFPVVWRCGRINYRDIEWLSSKAGLMSKRQWWRCGAAEDDTWNNATLQEESRSAGLLFVPSFVKWIAVGFFNKCTATSGVFQII